MRAERDFLYSEEQVKEMWKRSYGEQLGVAQAKCCEAISRTNGKLAVSFSGGKDSAVLLLLMAEMWSISIHKDEPLHVIFSNTSNEFVCMWQYVQDYVAWIEQKVNIKIELHRVQSELNYFQVTDMVGMPFVSKKVSRMIRDCKKAFRELGLTYEKDVAPLMPEHYTPAHYDEMVAAAEKLRELGIGNVVILYLTKITSQNRLSQQRFLPIQYRPMIDFDVDFSEECCKHLKKDPIKALGRELGHLLPVTGEMACDSKDRMNAYRITGCNMFDGERPKSKPLGPMTEQVLLRFIYRKNCRLRRLMVCCRMTRIPIHTNFQENRGQGVNCAASGFSLTLKGLSGCKRLNQILSSLHLPGERGAGLGTGEYAPS